MQKLLITLTALVLLFGGLWAYKLKTAKIEKTSETVETVKKDMWWLEDTDYSIEDVEEEWLLDATIPSNYVPVPDADELYMVIDDNGNIIEYRHRYKLEGDEDTWYWETVEEEKESEFKPVEGKEGLFYKLNDKGEKEYYKYIRNEDNTYAYVRVDENGSSLELKENIEKVEETQKIPENFIEIKDDLFAVLNDNNVVIGYVNKDTDENNNILWSEITQGEIENKLENEKKPTISITTKEPLVVTSPVITTKPPVVTTAPVHSDTPTATVTTKPSENETDKSYTKEVTELSTKIVGDYKITYETTYIYTYDADGILISTKKGATKEISRVKVDEGTLNPPTIEKDIDKELERVSTGISIDETMAQTILSKLNSERAEKGKNALSMSVNSEIYKAAVLYACDMAQYNHSDISTMSYGRLTELFELYNIKSNGSVGQHLWRCLTSNTASDVHSRFQSIESCREERMNEKFTNVAIVVIENNGYYYICELLY